LNLDLRVGETDPPKVVSIACSSPIWHIDIESGHKQDSKASMTWKSLLDEHHYLGSGPLSGSIRYLIHSSAYGYIAL